MLLLVVPPLALLARALGRFAAQWFRGWPLDPAHARTAVAHAPANAPACPACGRPISAQARRCPYCELRFDDAPLLAPRRRRLVRF
jgi:predicted amidophosphoribosyltransferase